MAEPLEDPFVIAVNVIVERVALRVATLVLAQIGASAAPLARPAASPAPSAPAPANERPTARQSPGAEMVTEKQLGKLQNIRRDGLLWEVIREIAGDEPQRFEDLTAEEAQAAIDGFYERSGGKKPFPTGGGRR